MTALQVLQVPQKKTRRVGEMEICVFERELFLFCVLVGACCAVICEVGLLLVLRFGGV